MSQQSSLPEDVDATSTVIACLLKYIPRTHWDAALESAKEKAGAAPIHFTTKRVKPLSEITARDVPRGLDPEDVATDCT